MTEAEDNPDFAIDDEFTAEEFYPFTPIQVWAVLNPEVTPDQLAVLNFTMCHLNPLNGKFDAKFSRQRVSAHFRRSIDWVDKQFRGLADHGAVVGQHMFYLDSKNRGPNAPRSPQRIDPETGKNRAQATNRWRVRMRPPGGQAFPGPLNIGEYYRPERIEARMQAAGGAAAQRPPSEQAKSAGKSKTPGEGGAAAQRPGGAATQRPGGAAAQRPKQSSKGTSKGGTTSVRPVSNAGAKTSEADRTDGRTDDFSADATTSSDQAPQAVVPDPEPENRGAALVAAEALQADLARIDTKPSQRRRLIKAVDGALLRFPEAQVARYLAIKARKAETAMWLIAAFEEFADAIKLVGNRYDRDAPGLDSALMDDIMAEVRATLADAAAAPAAEQDPGQQQVSPASSTAAPTAQPVFVAAAPAPKPAPTAPPLDLFTAPGIKLEFMASRVRDQLKNTPDSPPAPSGVQRSVAG